MSRMRAALAAGLCLSAVLAASPNVSAGAASRDETELVELGRRLFFDPALGRAGRIGCASCHDPKHGFSEPRRLSEDESGPLPRRSQPLTDLGGRGFHWDGEFDTVREIVEARILPRGVVAANGIARTVVRAETAQAAGQTWDRARLRERADAGLTPVYYGDARVTGAISVKSPEGESLVDLRLAASGHYAKGFAAAFGSEKPTLEGVVSAVDAYVRSLRTTANAYDRFLAGDAQALSPAARRGRDVFVGKGGCAQCHVATPEGGGVAKFTDGEFHDTGVAWDEAEKTYADRGAGAPHLTAAKDGAFKTPSLRDVARRAPYMHDGRFATLEDVVRYYDRGGTPHEGLDAKIKPLQLSESDVAGLVAFLESLDGRERAGLGSVRPGRPKTLRIRVADVSGVALQGRQVEIRPAGDRLRGAEGGAATVKKITGPDGIVTVPWPLSTHVEIVCTGRECMPLGLVPDYVASAELVVLGEQKLLYSLPTGICEEAPVLHGIPLGSGTRESTITLTRVRMLPNGRSLYSRSAAGVSREGTFELEPADGSHSLGTFELGNWLWTFDAADLSPRFPSPPPPAPLGEDVVKRLTALLPARGR